MGRTDLRSWTNRYFESIRALYKDDNNRVWRFNSGFAVGIEPDSWDLAPKQERMVDSFELNRRIRISHNSFR